MWGFHTEDRLPDNNFTPSLTVLPTVSAQAVSRISKPGLSSIYPRRNLPAGLPRLRIQCAPFNSSVGIMQDVLLDFRALIHSQHLLGPASPITESPTHLPEQENITRNTPSPRELSAV